MARSARRAPRRAAFRRVVVMAKPGTREGRRIASELGRWLGERGVAVRFDAETSRALGRRDGVEAGAFPRETDLVIVAGGDGTLLSVARTAGPRGIPILGVNFGGLGFMTELQPEEIYVALERILAGDFAIEEREALRVRFRRRGKRPTEHALLNDAVITKTALARMLVIALRIDGERVATYTSDGLIVSTPTGSTAYNLSAGGPILDPRMSAFVIAPICPHAMSYRPLVVPGTVTLEATLENKTEAAYLTLDGQVGFPMAHGDTIVVDRHPRAVRLLRVAGRGFFEVLQRKLHWGGR